MTQLILASTSSARRMILANAGVECDAMAPMVDEDAVKQSFLNQNVSARDIADALAEAKAVKLSLKNPAALVIGADQTLECADGILLDKPDSPEQAISQLTQMAGATHKLYSAAVVAERGEPVWRFVATSRMTMRPLSDDFIAAYVDAHWDSIKHCVGCYQIEGAGVQLFSQIQASHFDIMGLPLLPVLSFLRERGILAI
ncbi:MAG: nucleoside triphosphate pyrophosphatase [Sphingorhabdus sp.]